ncbi:MAG: aminotransferase class III-fold pyridoxal phosphate-dependent enzyme, partial [Actinobacteria bacterium]|nr:aminotransferase class III-fold pyridoxal phosphate-dependent enzyme [Actinomycetota bacterium]
MTAPDVTTDKVQRVLEQELARYGQRTPKSAALYERAEASMPFGVASSFQAGDPYPLYMDSGNGSHLTDVDGNTYVDYHNGFGAMAVGHAHPKVRAAIERAA